jgi:6-phosphogluconolactonase
MKRAAMLFVPAALLGLALNGCQDNQGPGELTAPVSRNAAAGIEKSAVPFSDGGEQGVVYTISNEASGNNVLRFARSAAGTLTPAGSFATGGTGNSGSLASQGALFLGAHYLYAVNAGSNEISVLETAGGGLHVVSKVSSGGTLPVSVTVHGDMLFVLNAGGSGNIAGFTGAAQGSLLPLPGSIKPLSGPAVGPAEVAFSPDGQTVVVTEKNTQKIDTYDVEGHGGVSGPKVQNSAGQTPYGFAFSQQGELVVSEATQSSLSSYRLVHDGDLRLISGQVPDHQLSACWVAITGNGKYAYTANAAAHNVSGYRLGPGGTLTLFGDGGVTGTGLMKPLDMATDRNSEFLYVLDAGGNSITAYKINGGDGSLSSLGSVGGLPVSAAGIAAN